MSGVGNSSTTLHDGDRRGRAKELGAHRLVYSGIAEIAKMLRELDHILPTAAGGGNCAAPAIEYEPYCSVLGPSFKSVDNSPVSSVLRRGSGGKSA